MTISAVKGQSLVFGRVFKGKTFWHLSLSVLRESSIHMYSYPLILD